ncbi:protein kinase [Striga asiatica]|uniref:Protein kinase n=1 Tax=Striga asiatica TaxID=4170 RepID=A0A5A7RJV0_STRAF|nr:protein kinase [Striga asiatica]
MMDEEANHVPSQEEEEDKEEEEEKYYDTQESFEDDDNILRDGNHTFRTMHEIGTTRLSLGTTPVYKASHFDDHGCPLGFVTSRRELDRMVREISAERRLPRRSDEMINVSGHSWKRIIRSGDYPKYSKAYSRGFECMVAGCLQRNPSKRPSVIELLRCGVFDILDKSSANRHQAFDLLRN